MKLNIFKSIIDTKKWATPQYCNTCGWERRPNDILTLKDAMFPSTVCGNCNGKIKNKILHCPICKIKFDGYRIPNNIRITFWGGNNYNKCKIETNKWGEIVCQQDDAPGSVSPD